MLNNKKKGEKMKIINRCPKCNKELINEKCNCSYDLGVDNNFMGYITFSDGRQIPLLNIKMRDDRKDLKECQI